MIAIIEIERNLNDCIYYALAKLLEGRMITADLKFLSKLQEDPLAG